MIFSSLLHKWPIYFPSSVNLKNQLRCVVLDLAQKIWPLEHTLSDSPFLLLSSMQSCNSLERDMTQLWTSKASTDGPLLSPPATLLSVHVFANTRLWVFSLFRGI